MVFEFPTNWDWISKFNFKRLPTDTQKSVIFYELSSPSTSDQLQTIWTRDQKVSCLIIVVRPLINDMTTSDPSPHEYTRQHQRYNACLPSQRFEVRGHPVESIALMSSDQSVADDAFDEWKAIRDDD